jgi:hypothetical protein
MNKEHPDIEFDLNPIEIEAPKIVNKWDLKIIQTVFWKFEKTNATTTMCCSFKRGFAFA